MSEKYKIRDQEKPYFITFSIVYWIDALTREEYIKILLESLKHCQREKGLEIYGWCIMSNHVHLIVGRCKDQNIEEIIRDFKKYTSVHICRAIETNQQESRREWMLWMFKRAGEKSGKHKKYMFWKNEYHPVELDDYKILQEKLNYIHMNPVKAGIVDEPWEYRYSSARDYSNYRKGLLDINFIE